MIVFLGLIILVAAVPMPSGKQPIREGRITAADHQPPRTGEPEMPPPALPAAGGESSSASPVNVEGRCDYDLGRRPVPQRSSLSVYRLVRLARSRRRFVANLAIA